MPQLRLTICAAKFSMRNQAKSIITIQNESSSGQPVRGELILPKLRPPKISIFRLRPTSRVNTHVANKVICDTTPFGVPLRLCGQEGCAPMSLRLTRKWLALVQEAFLSCYLEYSFIA